MSDTVKNHETLPSYDPDAQLFIFPEWPLSLQTATGISSLCFVGGYLSLYAPFTYQFNKDSPGYHPLLLSGYESLGYVSFFTAVIALFIASYMKQPLSSMGYCSISELYQMDAKHAHDFLEQRWLHWGTLGRIWRTTTVLSVVSAGAQLLIFVWIIATQDQG